MTFMPNSVEARDIAYQLHPLVDLRNYDKTGALVIERGEGIYVYDNAGRRYIEGLAGLWSVAVGFGERRLSDAAKRQMDQLSYYHIFAHKTHGPSVDLAEKLISLAPVPMSKVHFTSSGSEANDLVVKLAWYRSNALGKPEKKKIIGRLKGYHGVTIAAGSITGLPRNHESFDLPLDRMRHVSCPDYAGSALPGESEAAFSRRMADELEKLILAEGPDTVAAFFGEPVMASGGVYVPPENYWAEIQAVLRRYDVLLVADEVICGFGRTGAMFGCETFGIEPDVMVLSKQISSSYMPLSAILMNANFYEPIADESARLGVLGHGYTASGHPVATAVGLENIRIIEERDLVGNCRRLSPLFLERLAGLAEHPLVKTWRGVGLIGALELKPATAPGAKPGAAGAAIQAAALEQGVIARAIGDSLCFCPPLIITAEQIGAMFDAVGRALDTIAA
ncbi:aspartate aminotransferase family protein [Methylobacterium radiotolerans]|jgi:4-aminobutyrate---pyruvate transaminase|uniref:aspartate aminotransferase family protein n=1 Tax=Methylobacterium TaxID=407 RepID=UPI0005E01050|nr:MULTISPECIES: aspartate aminotransferase family protein [Methylobacterium]MBE7196567.1 aspartate aminotransferase family protein [Parafilimonas terrae]GAN46539.1 aminotransferase [Methylobacterium sp. ME121]MBN6818863.1 aspartate aminotransferase family protein [Methylobacterium organophilum]MBY0255238.1 aspartate aminotransferase family protein [Methylobacterium organophilum]MCX4194309.1 aspartate aminotransferase family protein [Methylobacterium organophilum]